MYIPSSDPTLRRSTDSRCGALPRWAGRSFVQTKVHNWQNHQPHCRIKVQPQLTWTQKGVQRPARAVACAAVEPSGVKCPQRLRQRPPAVAWTG